MQSPLLAFDLQLNGRSPSGDADFSPRLCVGFLFLILYPALPGPAASHNFVTYSLSHTTLSHAIFHTQLCHTLFHTHNFVTHSLSHTTLSHTTLSHTIFQTLSFTHNFVTHHFSHNFVTRVALGEIHLRFAWQAWRCTASTFVLRGRRGWHLRHWAGSGGALGRRWSRGDAAALCVAGVGDIHLHLAWEAWHLATSGVALHDIHLRFAWHSWRFWHRAGSGGALGRRFGPAGRAVTPRHFAWQAWRVATSTVTLRGTWRHQAWQFTTSTFCVTGVALTALGWLRWRAWAPLGRHWSRGDAAALCVAGVALGEIHLRFALQAWPFTTSTFVLRGRRGTSGTGLGLVARLGATGRAVTPRHFPWQGWHLRQRPPSLCVAGVALGDIRRVI